MELLLRIQNLNVPVNADDLSLVGVEVLGVEEHVAAIREILGIVLPLGKAVNIGFCIDSELIEMKVYGFVPRMFSGI
jgi:hypothetical protein